MKISKKKQEIKELKELEKKFIVKDLNSVKRITELEKTALTCQVCLRPFNNKKSLSNHTKKHRNDLFAFAKQKNPALTWQEFMKIKEKQ